MSGLVDYEVGDTLRRGIDTSNPSTGAAANADGNVVWQMYEDGVIMAARTGNASNVTTGHYTFSEALSSGNGYEAGKTYTCRITATIGGVACADSFTFRCVAARPTAAALQTVDDNVDAILVDTGTTLPGTLTTMDGKLDTIDGVVDAILADTGTDGVVLAADSVNATSVDAALQADIAAEVWDALLSAHTTAGTFGLAVADVLTDTGTTLPGSLSTIASAVSTIDSNITTIDGIVDAILVDTGTTLPASLAAIEADTQDLQSRTPAALSSGGNMPCDVQEIDESSSAAARLAEGAAAVIGVTVNGGTPTTTSCVLAAITGSSLPSGAIAVWTRRIFFKTGVLAGQERKVTAWTGTSGSSTVTYEAFPSAPSNGDQAVIA